jgi:hypothetical protein
MTSWKSYFLSSIRIRIQAIYWFEDSHTKKFVLHEHCICVGLKWAGCTLWGGIYLLVSGGTDGIQGNAMQTVQRLDLRWLAHMHLFFLLRLVEKLVTWSLFQTVQRNRSQLIGSHNYFFSSYWLKNWSRQSLQTVQRLADRRSLAHIIIFSLLIGWTGHDSCCKLFSV